MSLSVSVVFVSVIVCPFPRWQGGWKRSSRREARMTRRLHYIFSSNDVESFILLFFPHLHLRYVQVGFVWIDLAVSHPGDRFNTSCIRLKSKLINHAANIFDRHFWMESKFAAKCQVKLVRNWLKFDFKTWAEGSKEFTNGWNSKIIVFRYILIRSLLGNT